MVKCIYEYLFGEENMNNNFLKHFRVLAAVCITSLFVSIIPSLVNAAESATKVLIGDLNRDKAVNSLDFAAFRMHLLGIDSNIDLSASDVNNDEAVNSIDFAVLRGFLLGTIPELPFTKVITVTPTPTIISTPKTTPTLAPTPLQTYVAYDTIYSMTDTSINRTTTDHFQAIWGNSGSMTKENALEILKNLESVRECYINEIGIKDPGISTDSRYSGTKRKTNLYIANTGLSKHSDGGWAAFMSADTMGMGYMIICPDGLRVNPPSTVAAHEFGHVVHYHLKGWNDQTITGPWWESVANWFAERYMVSDYYSYNGKNYSPATDYFAPLYENLDCCQPNKDDYYQYWPFIQYLEENPDNLPGLGKGFFVKMVQQAGKNEYPYDNIARVSGTPIKTILGNFAKRIATQDFINPVNYSSAKYNTLINLYRNSFARQIANTTSKSKILTTLNKSSENEWWNVSNDRAPMQSGINIIPVTASIYSIDMSGTKTITADFQALQSQRSDGDFQVCFAAIDKLGKATYSPLWSTGQGSITIDQNTQSLYLVVVATPKTMIPTSAFNETAESQIRFPYRVKFGTK